MTGTNDGGTTNIDSYNCSGFNESGPEIVYSFVAEADGTLEAALSDLNLIDLDVFILGPAECTAETCLAVGNLTAMINPLGNSFTFEYDPLGRKIRRDEAEGQTLWTYDSAAHGIGRPAIERQTPRSRAEAAMVPATSPLGLRSVRSAPASSGNSG